MNSVQTVPETVGARRVQLTGGAPIPPPLPGFQAILGNIVDLLQSLFAPSDAPNRLVDLSKSLGLERKAPAAPKAPGPAPSEPDSARRSDSPEEEVRERVFEEIERRLAQLPSEEIPIQLQDVRQLLQQIELNAQTAGGSPSASSAPVLEDLLPLIQDLQGQLNREAPPPAPPPPVPSQPVPMESKGENPVVPLAQSLPLTTASPSTKTHAQPVELPTPPAPPAPPESLAIQAPPPAPSARALEPTAASTLNVTIVAASSEAVTAPRTDAVVRGTAPAEMRRSEMFSSAARAAKSESPAPDTDRVEFVERLMKAARVTQLRGQTHLRMVLHPPHLGQLKVDLAMKDRVLHGTLTAETGTARETIVSHLQSLRDQLESQGIRVGDFQVGVEQGFSQAHPQDPDRGPARHDRPRTEPAEVADPGATPERMRSARTQLIDMMA